MSFILSFNKTTIIHNLKEIISIQETSLEDIKNSIKTRW